MEKDNVKGRYFYLMLKDNFYDSDDMVLLESMENGYLYSNILLKLYLKSLKDKGKLMYKDRIPYNAEMLAKLTRHNVDVVRRAIEIFQQMGIIEILDNGAIFMLDIENYIGKSSTEADRRRAYDRRIATEKQQLLLSEKSCEKSHEHIDIELDTELNINKKDKKKKEVKHKYGEYQNVFFTEEQYTKLTNEFPNDYKERIDKLDYYMQSTGKKYKDCLATIRNWARNEKGANKNGNVKKSIGSEYANLC
jgi:predicted phage replisome organizer